MTNPKSKMTFSHWGGKVTIQKDHSDITIEEFFEMVRCIALGAGFSEESINQYLEQ